MFTIKIPVTELEWDEKDQDDNSSSFHPCDHWNLVNCFCRGDCSCHWQDLSVDTWMYEVARYTLDPIFNKQSNCLRNCYRADAIIYYTEADAAWRAYSRIRKSYPMVEHYVHWSKGFQKGMALLGRKENEST